MTRQQVGVTQVATREQNSQKKKTTDECPELHQEVVNGWTWKAPAQCQLETFTFIHHHNTTVTQQLEKIWKNARKLASSALSPHIWLKFDQRKPLCTVGDAEDYISLAH